MKRAPRRGCPSQEKTPSSTPSAQSIKRSEETQTICPDVGTSMFGGASPACDIRRAYCCRSYRAAINEFFDLGYFLAYAARIVPAEIKALKGGLQNAHVYCF